MFNVATPGLQLYGCHPRPRERVRENDLGFPGAPAFLRLAEVLGVPAERLVEGVDDPAGEEAEGGEEGSRRKRKGEEE
jgi:hypothetical protein